MTSWFGEKLRRSLVGVAAAALIGAVALPATGQEAGLSESVVAIVNNDIISSYDLVQRMRLLVVTAGIQVTQENLPQIQQEALRSLVDERLQIQELRRVEREQRFQIVANDQDVAAEIAEIARGNNTTPENLMATLAAQGVGPETFRNQIRAEISWQRWIRGRYGTRIRIGEDQIAAVQARLAANATRTQFQVSEIFIDAARAGGMDAAIAGAQQLVGQLQAGAPFPAVARQFSSAPTAASGGDAGWVVSGDVPPEVEAALTQLRPGQLSAPIPVRDGVYIVFLRDRRSGSNATMVQLKQAAIPLAPEATPEQVAAATQQLEALRPQITGCGDLEARAQAAGIVAGDLGEAEVNELAPAFRDAAAPLAVGQLSAPIRTNVGLHIIAVCSRRQSGADAPSHDQIENRLLGQQLSMVSRRVMRDLRTSATIETR